MSTIRLQPSTIWYRTGESYPDAIGESYPDVTGEFETDIDTVEGWMSDDEIVLAFSCAMTPVNGGKRLFRALEPFQMDKIDIING